MKDKDYIEELFSKKLSEHQVSVRPEVWDAIQSKMIASSTVATTSVASKSLLIKGIIGLSSLAAISVGTYFLIQDKSTDKNPQQVVKEQVNSVVKEAETQKEAVTLSFDKKEEKSEKTTIVANEIEENKLENNKLDNRTDNIIDNHQPQKGHSQPIKGTSEPVFVESPTSIGKSENNKEEGAKKPVVLSGQTNDKTETGQTQKETVASTQSFVKPWSKTNVFTPNGDGVNDYFFVETEKLKEFSISVLDMNNNVVYVSEDAKFQWDGTNYKTGEKVPDGNYSYIIYAVGLNGEQIKHFNLLYITK